jgi:SagB-type dehydrogenase family enzyme
MHARTAGFAVLGTALALGIPSRTTAQDPDVELIPLPAPRHTSETSVEQALTERRSVREFADASVSLEEVAQLLWAAQGVTEPIDDRPSTWPPEWQWMGGLRTAPSAGALYPLEVYLVVGNVEGFDAGLYRYVPQTHALEPTAEGNMRELLAGAVFRQSSITQAAAVLVIAAVYERVAVKYGDRGTRYARIEVGAVAQCIYLQAEALDLGTVLIGAFTDADVKDVLELPAEHEPLAIMPVGRRNPD